MSSISPICPPFPLPIPLTLPTLPTTLTPQRKQLYIKLYPDQLTRCPTTIEAFVKAVWDLVGGGRMPGVRDDAVSR